VSTDPQDVIVTYSLGSCIGVCLFDPTASVAGMLHYQLPSSSMDTARAVQKPAMFADTGMHLLLRQMELLGGQKNRMQVKLVGGASMLNDVSSQAIGKRNHTAIRKVLWQHGMFIKFEEIGGNIPRTIYFCVADGSLTIKSAGIAKAA
jgi:chemotaxis protein CheD